MSVVSLQGKGGDVTHKKIQKIWRSLAISWQKLHCGINSDFKCRLSPGFDCDDEYIAYNRMYYRI